jgi:hypothetical protein
MEFLSGLLHSAIMLSASSDCRCSIERRIGLQLEHATVEDLLLPNLAYNLEVLYDIDCVGRILDHFLLFEQSAGRIPSNSAFDSDGSSCGDDDDDDDDSDDEDVDEEEEHDDDDDDDDGHLMNSPNSLNPMRMVARLIDGYLAEVAPDVNLKASKFQALAEALPSYSRTSHDGLYRAIDIYLKVNML